SNTWTSWDLSTRYVWDLSSSWSWDASSSYQYDAGFGGSTGGCSSPPGPKPVYTPPTPSALEVPHAVDLAAAASPGPYDYEEVPPLDRGVIGAWLEERGFHGFADEVEAIAPYVKAGYHVVAFRLRPDVPPPFDSIALTYEASELRFPIGLIAHGATSAW